MGLRIEFVGLGIHDGPLLEKMCYVSEAYYSTSVQCSVKGLLAFLGEYFYDNAAGRCSAARDISHHSSVYYSGAIALDGCAIEDKPRTAVRQVSQRQNWGGFLVEYFYDKMKLLANSIDRVCLKRDIVSPSPYPLPRGHGRGD